MRTLAFYQPNFRIEIIFLPAGIFTVIAGEVLDMVNTELAEQPVCAVKE